eukprot:gene7109-8481_t
MIRTLMHPPFRPSVHDNDNPKDGTGVRMKAEDAELMMVAALAVVVMEVGMAEGRMVVVVVAMVIVVAMVVVTRSNVNAAPEACTNRLAPLTPDPTSQMAVQLSKSDYMRIPKYNEIQGTEFFAGYLLEESLSVDNLFVFVLIFSYFEVPKQNQSKVLAYGIYGAAIMRLFMIRILLFSSFKLLVAGDEEDEEDLSENFVVKFCQKLIPVSDEYVEDNFFTLVKGVKTATPLLLVLAIVELSDVVFAVDSIPAVFGVTKDPFITAVALVLGFVGAKMVGDFAGFSISTEQSLIVVASLIGGGVGLSYALP